MSDRTAGKPRLLIVDDSKVIRVTARKILRDHFETTEAIDGENAWEILSGDKAFSMVVTDLTMPNLDGFGLIERIRNSPLPHVCGIPVIVITGSNDSETVKERARQAGATDFIGKPFDSVHLLARTQAHASSHSKTRTLKEEKVTLEENALVDPLTGLSNETAFMERSYQQLSYAIRHSTSLSMFRIEIDDYGDLYASYGDKIVERVVKTVTMVLQTAIRQEDTAARIGTARFALLLPGMNNTGIRTLAERINRDISSRIIRHEGTRIRVTVSIGIASPDIQRNTRFEELLSTADQRLAHAISQGGNQVVYRDPEIIPSATGKAVFVTDSSVYEENDVEELSEIPAPKPKPFDIAELIENGAEIEEVEAFAPDSTVGYLDSTTKTAPGTDNSDASLPGKFAGPVPDIATKIDVPEPVPAPAPGVGKSSAASRTTEKADKTGTVVNKPRATGAQPAARNKSGKPAVSSPAAAPAEPAKNLQSPFQDSIEYTSHERGILMRLVIAIFTPWNWFR